MTRSNKSILLVILTAIPFILFSQQNELSSFPRSVSSKQYGLKEKITYNLPFIHNEQATPINCTSIRKIDTANKKSPFFINVDMGLRYDSPYGGLGFFVQLDTRTLMAPNIWIGDDISHNRFLARGGLKFYLPSVKIIESSSIYTQVSYGVVTRNINQRTIITEGGPVLGQWGEVLEIIDGSIEIKKTSYWTFGPSISAGVEYKLSKRFKINTELGMSYIVSGDGESHKSVYPLLQFGVVNSYW
jgi:hypothetical protein